MFCFKPLPVESKTSPSLSSEVRKQDQTTSTPIDFEFKTTPYDHQLDAFHTSRDERVFALLMEMGTGKTKVAIDTAAYLFEKGEIEALVVIAPNGVHRKWINQEIPVHLPDRIEHHSAYWSANANKLEKQALEGLKYAAPEAMKIFSVNVEGLSTKRCFEFTYKVCNTFKTLLVVDESTRIKNHKAQRTKNVMKLGKLAEYRRILTGTPVTQSPLDCWTQFNFLHSEIIGYPSFVAFRARYAMLKEMHLQGRSYPVKIVTGYRNIEELSNKVARHSYRVLKRDCLDLPEKVYQVEEVDLTAEQKRIYKDMKDDLVARISDTEYAVARIVLTQLLRLHQIVGGHLTTEGELKTVPIDGGNPKLNRMLEILEDIDSKAQVIIWAKFQHEIDDIHAALENSAVYDGRTPSDRRTEIIDEFNAGKIKYFIGNQNAGGIGIDLTAASYVIYLSNDFSLETRLQSEDRAHRIGQVNRVTYIDLVARDTIDELVLDALKNKQDLADLITKDQSWLR